jgi:AraC-like DNA-binding protein
MNLTIDIFSIIFILGALQGIFLSIVLFTRYRKSKANIYLAWLILSYSVFLVQQLLSGIEQLSRNYPHFLMILMGLPFLLGPLHLMYISVLTDSRIKFARLHWLHFVPFILFKIYYLQVFFLSKEELNNIIMQVEQNNPPLHLLISGVAVAVQGLIYVIVALFVFREYLQKIKLTFSTIEKINLNWLKYFTIMALFVWIIVFVEEISRIISIDTGAISFLVPVLTSIFVYATGYIGMFKTEIFQQYDIYNNIHAIQDMTVAFNSSREEIDTTSKYQKSGLSPEKADEYLNRLKKLMEENEIYTNADITLKDLSEHLDTSTHNISEVINTRLNQNFFDFINRYRIEKVKKDLLDKSKEHYTLFAIAVDAGFNSKSGFNAIFKRYTGQTPSEYRNTLQQ